MSGAIIGGLGSLITGLFDLWSKNKQQQTMNTGINYQKATSDGKALKDAADSQVISGDVDRMSDDQVRRSSAASFRNE